MKSIIATFLLYTLCALFVLNLLASERAYVPNEIKKNPENLVMEHASSIKAVCASVDSMRVDNDGDGISLEDGDCDDNDPNVYPGAPEICDGKDSDCDGTILFYEMDGDSDGVIYCQDCDDNDPLNTTVSDTTWFFLDADGDGFGDRTDSIRDWTCNPSPNRVLNKNDCDDSDAAVYPGAPEICDGKDSDCDGTIFFYEMDGDGDGVIYCQDCDDDDSLNTTLSDTTWFFLDADGDGFGDRTDSIRDWTCNPSPNRVLNKNDCDDSDAAVYPGAPELCDGQDSNCNGIQNEVDSDGDGLFACEECDDTDPSSQVYDDSTFYYLDADGDGYGDINDVVTGWSCLSIPGRVTNGDDCDDSDPAVNPTAEEICNGLDDNCDGIAELDADQDTIPDCIDNCIVTFNPDQLDSDCDGVGDACDVCPGVDDAIDNDGNGVPDCLIFPGEQLIEPSWRCELRRPTQNDGILICRNGRTSCLNVRRFNPGDTIEGYLLGPCVANCTEALPIVYPENIGNTTLQNGDRWPDGLAILNYVNPVTHTLSLNLYGYPRAGAASIYIIDMMGKLWIEQHIAKLIQPQIEISTVKLSPGSYILSVVIEGKRVSRTLIKM